MEDKNKTPAEMFKDYISEIDSKDLSLELCQSFVDMLDFITYLGLQDDYVIWAEDRAAYKQLRKIPQSYFRSWIRKNHNEEQDN
tara:strand:- start:185 stop:436 length:252 start_codon:yes stop_codon:yes gene_type:complete